MDDAARDRIPAKASGSFDGWLGNHLWLGVVAWLGLTFTAHYLSTCRGLDTIDVRVALFSMSSVLLFMRVQRVAVRRVPDGTRQFMWMVVSAVSFLGFNFGFHVAFMAACGR